MVPSVLKTIEISLLQFIGKVVDVLVVQVVQVSLVPVVEKTGGSHSCRSLRKSLRSSSSWTRWLHARWCTTTGACRDSAENCRGSALAVHRTRSSPSLSITSSCGGYGGGEGVFAVICGIFRTPSSWTSSARLAATFLSPRWPTVVGRRGLPCCAAVFLDSISTQTSLSISCPHHHHPHTHTYTNTHTHTQTDSDLESVLRKS